MQNRIDIAKQTIWKIMKLREILEKLRFLYKDDCNCMICDEELEIQNRYGLCRTCMESLPKNNKRICERCGKPMNNEARFCLGCQNEKRYFDAVRSALIYKEDIVKIILSLKFHNRRYTARYLAAYYKDVLHNYPFEYDIAIPIPLSAARMKQRKYNQVEEILRFTDIDKIDNSILVKLKDTEQQSKLTGKERRENIVGAFGVVKPELVKSKRILLFDDVLTTGATMNEAARVLKSAGATKVNGITIANAEYRLAAETYRETDFQEIDLCELIGIDK